MGVLSHCSAMMVYGVRHMRRAPSRQSTISIILALRGSEVAAAPDLHSGDPRTIHFPTDSTMGCCTDEHMPPTQLRHSGAPFQFRTHVVQDIVTFDQMKL